MAMRIILAQGGTRYSRALAWADAKQVARLYRQAFGAYSITRDSAVNQMRILCSRMPQQPHANMAGRPIFVHPCGLTPDSRTHARPNAPPTARLLDRLPYGAYAWPVAPAAAAPP